MSVSSLVIVCIIISILFSYLDFFKYKILSIIAKSCATTSIILLCVECYKVNNACTRMYYLLILTGLTCGLIGDIFLALKKIYIYKEETFFLLGIAAFLSGHIFYIAAYNMIIPINEYDFIFGLILICILYYIYNSLNINLRHINFAVASYAAVLSFLAGKSISIFLSSTGQTLNIMIFLGTISFFISDFFVAMSSFYNRISKIYPVLVHAFYFPAQIMIALSVLFFIP